MSHWGNPDAWAFRCSSFLAQLDLENALSATLALTPSPSRWRELLQVVVRGNRAADQWSAELDACQAFAEDTALSVSLR